MKNHRRLLSLALALVLALCLGVPAFAAVEETGFSDVAADAWYAGAVAYVQEKGIMNGTSATTFAPDATTTRGQMAAILYRAAGSPGATGSVSFSDVAENAYYAQAVRWANANGIITGYQDGTFRADNPVTREQMTTILWRYAGSPAMGAVSLSDGASVSSYAVSAVNWAAANNIVAPVSEGVFAPRSPATRAQIAAALMNYDRVARPAGGAGGGSKILVAYFTVPETSGVDAVAQASRVVENGEVVGNVEFIARAIQEETGGDVFAIETVQTYPGEHQALLDFAAAEMAANARPELSAGISNLSDYDVIFLGYPIWNADLPMPVYTFLDTYDLSGKTVIPFTAHGGSGFAGTISTVASQEPGARVERNGFSVSRNSVSAARGDVADWVESLGYGKADQSAAASDHRADVLVAYFSQTGTTERVARQIAEYTGGDLAEIRRARPYGNLQSEARAEIDSGTRPDITVGGNDPGEYDVIFIGYPIWWDEAPAMIASFLAENDFGGKIIAPFCTSSYSPIDNSLHIFRELASGAAIVSGLTANSQSAVRPWVDQVISQAALAREKNIDFILAVGGGSVIDCCKVIAAQAVLDEDIWEMELVRRRFPAVPPIPMGAVVTASGTGAEMNGGAVITHEEKKVKTGIFAAAPRFAVLDPDYTMSVPFAQVMSGAFDTLSHAMETYFGRAGRDNVSDDIAEAVMRNTIRNMRALLRKPDDYTARSNLMWDSAMAENGILKCGRATDFQAHQIEHQLGAYTDCNHGQGLAVIHPTLYRVMCQKAPEKFARFAVNVWNVSGEGRTERELALAGVEALADFIKECELPTRLEELAMRIDSTRLCASGILKKIADSCNLIQSGQAQVNHAEIYEVLREYL